MPWVGKQCVIVVFPDHIINFYFYLVADLHSYTLYIHEFYSGLQTHLGMLYFIKQRTNKHEWHNP